MLSGWLAIAACGTMDAKMIKQLLPMVSSLAIRVKLTSTELSDALSMLKLAELNLE